MKKRHIIIIVMFVIAIPTLILSGPVSAFKADHCLERGASVSASSKHVRSEVGVGAGSE